MNLINSMQLQFHNKQIKKNVPQHTQKKKHRIERPSKRKQQRGGATSRAGKLPDVNHQVPTL
jgi:hypothetical protein